MTLFLSVRSLDADRISGTAAKVLGSDSDGTWHYAVLEVPPELEDDPTEPHDPDRTRVVRGDTLQALLDAIYALEGDDTRHMEADVVQQAMYERGEDGWTKTVRGLEALRDRLALLGIPEYGEPEAALLEEALDLIRTHALPEDHPLANL